MFSCDFAKNYAKFLRTPFFTEHVWATASQAWGFFWSGCEHLKEREQESWRALVKKFVFHSFYQTV